VSRPRKPGSSKPKLEPPKKGSRKPLPEELARAAIAHEDEAPGGKVRMTFRVLLTRQQAEALAARAIQEEKNLEPLVAEILEAAAVKGKA
jgi:hypothetical protein